MKIFYRFSLFGVIFLVAAMVLNFSFMPTLAYASEVNNQKDTIIKGTAIAALILIIAKLGKDIFKAPDNRVDNTLPKNSKYPDSDLDWLAHIIHGESRGEPFEGQVAVGAVVLNRVKDKGFPNTIREVILAQNQFTAVSDGQFFLTPNDSSYKAAQRALSGEDPSRGALFFYNPATARNVKWFQTLTKLVTIGTHVFLTY